MQLPTFEGSRCLAFTACGHIEEPAVDLREWVKELKKHEFVARYRAANGVVFFRVLLDHQAKDLHLHVDLARPAAFGKGKPGVHHKRQDLVNLLNRFSGAAIYGDVRSRYRFTAAETPKSGPFAPRVVRLDEAAGVRIHMTGARFEIETKGPKLDVAWSVADGGLELRVETPYLTKVVDSYLTELFEAGENIARALLLPGGATTDAETGRPATS